jgi:hypothetical protein
MPLHAGEPPKEAAKIIGAGLAGLLNHPRSATYAAISGISPGELSVALPHPVYFVGVDNLVSGSLVEAAVFSGWRYIILHHDRPLLAAALTSGIKTKEFEFSHASFSPFVSATIKGIRRAGKSKKLEKHAFELRLLEMPSLAVVSLWFHAKGHDFFMPLPPVRKPLKSYKLYSEVTLTDALKDSASKRIEVKDARA